MKLGEILLIPTIFIILNLSMNVGVTGYPVFVPYLTEKDGSIVMWESTTITYKVVNSLEDDKRFESWASTAFYVWEHKLNGTIDFIEKVQHGDADIKVYVMHDISEICQNDNAVGCMVMETDDHGVINTVEIFTSDRQCTVKTEKFGMQLCNRVKPQDYKLMILHEIGHALGLDHANDDLQKPVSIMYYKLNANMTITDGDVCAVKLLYERGC